jgi:anaerobic ribonucleoside-triphosphate reductase activating protein
MDGKTVRIAGYKAHSFVNGPGSRFVLFMQGCPHRCKHCQNPETWDMNQGEQHTIDEISELICNTPHINGVTFSGGDPVAQPQALAQLIMNAKTANLNVWVYTGWTYETLHSMERLMPYIKTILDNADVLVDGMFVEELKSEDCIYRGSTNQRLIDLPATRRSGTVVLYDPENENDLTKGTDIMPAPNQENKIYTHDEAARLIDMFEEVLAKYNIHVPSPEDEEREEDNMVGLYGTTYSELLDNVENHLIDLLDRKNPDTEIVKDVFSGTY